MVITDLDVLRQVGAELGLELVEDTTYKWYGRWVKDYNADDAAYKHGISPENYGKCDGWKLRIKDNPSAYEIGLHKNPNGEGFVLVYDFYGTPGHALREKIGEKGEKIKQGYSLALAKKHLTKKGFKVVGQQTTEDGKKVRLQLQRGY